jgi:hypothetical protein
LFDDENYYEKISEERFTEFYKGVAEWRRGVYRRSHRGEYTGERELGRSTRELRVPRELATEHKSKPR